MKKYTKSTIALAAALLLLSGTFAAAADLEDVSQSAKNNVTREQNRTANPVNVAAGVVDLDQDESSHGGGGPIFLKPFPPKPVDPKKWAVDGICLNLPINGQQICF